MSSVRLGVPKSSSVWVPCESFLLDLGNPSQTPHLLCSLDVTLGRRDVGDKCCEENKMCWRLFFNLFCVFQTKGSRLWLNIGKDAMRSVKWKQLWGNYMFFWWSNLYFNKTLNINGTGLPNDSLQASKNWKWSLKDLFQAFCITVIWPVFRNLLPQPESNLSFRGFNLLPKLTKLNFIS